MELLMGKFCQTFTELSARDTPIFSFPNIIRRSVLESLMGKFRPIFTELSARDTPIFSFPDNNLSK